MLKGSFFRFFPTPTYLQMPTAGLHLSPHGVFFLELERSEGMYRVRQYCKRYCEGEVITDGNVVDRDALVACLREVGNETDTHFVRLCLPEEKSYLYYTSIPYVASENEMRDSVRFTIEENVPFSVQDVVFDYDVVSQSEVEEGQEVGVVVSVLPREVINAYLEVLDAGGFRPMSLMLEPQAVARAVVSHDYDRAVFILHTGSTKSSIFIVYNNVVHFTTTFENGQGAAQSQDAGLTFNGANAKGSQENGAKHKGGSADDETSSENDPSHYAADIDMDTVAEQLQRVNGYWNDRTDGESEFTIQKIIISGTFAHDRRFLRQVGARTELPVEEGNVWTNVLSLEQRVPRIYANEAMEFAPTIGLALPNI